MRRLEVNAERRDQPPENVSQDLILWRLEGLEADMVDVKKSMDQIITSLEAYKAVMKFAVAMGAAVGSAVAFVANLLFRYQD